MNDYHMTQLFTTKKSLFFKVLLIFALIFVMVQPAMAQSANPNPNPGVIPNQGPKYGDLGAKWWLWALSFPQADVPFFNQGGPVDISAHQSGNVWFLAGGNTLQNGPRTGEVPAGKSLFFPVVNLINDYPCPDPDFKPAAGESLEEFLQRTGNDFLPSFTDLFAEIDGVPVTNLSAYRATSSMFQFKADPALASWDPCITGTRQNGVAVGYWLLLPPLTPGRHTLHFGTPTWTQDITYNLVVKANSR